MPDPILPEEPEPERFWNNVATIRRAQCNYAASRLEEAAKKIKEQSALMKALDPGSVTRFLLEMAAKERQGT